MPLLLVSPFPSTLWWIFTLRWINQEAKRVARFVTNSPHIIQKIQESWCEILLLLFSCCLDVVSLLDISEVKEIFRVKYQLIMIWQDKRLRYLNLKTKCERRNTFPLSSCSRTLANQCTAFVFFAVANSLA